MKNTKTVVEILKENDIKPGFKLYSSVMGECTLKDYIDSHISVESELGFKYIFDKYGRLSSKGECLLFPSKEERDWNKFIPFKDGDIIFEDRFNSICIFKKEGSIKGTVDYYWGISFGKLCVKDEKDIDRHFGAISDYRFATEEEKEKLFQVIKDKGYKWNAEIKTLEKLVEPKFKVGDKIKHKSGRCSSCTIKAIENNVYILKEIWSTLPINEQHEYELVPNKFDISTLKPFDKVLVRFGGSNSHTWKAGFFSNIDKSNNKSYFVVNTHYWSQCIPFEGNEQLLGTTNDCDEYYKTW